MNIKNKAGNASTIFLPSYPHLSQKPATKWWQALAQRAGGGPYVVTSETHFSPPLSGFQLICYSWLCSQTDPWILGYRISCLGCPVYIIRPIRVTRGIILQELWIELVLSAFLWQADGLIHPLIPCWYAHFLSGYSERLPVSILVWFLWNYPDYDSSLYSSFIPYTGRNTCVYFTDRYILHRGNRTPVDANS